MKTLTTTSNLNDNMDSKKFLKELIKEVYVLSQQEINNREKPMKESLYIADLEESCEELGYRPLFEIYSDFETLGSVDGEQYFDFNEAQSLSSHTSEFLADTEYFISPENAEKQKAYCASVFETHKQKWSKNQKGSYQVSTFPVMDSLTEELKVELGSQISDYNDFPFANRSFDSSVVTVQVQRLSQNNRWYNVKGAKFTFEAEDVFAFDENGNICNFIEVNDAHYEEQDGQLVKRTTSRSSIYSLMASSGYTTVHSSSYVNFETGEVVYNSCPQRFLVSSKMFNAASRIGKESLPECVAHFNYKVDPKTKEISESYVGYAYEQISEMFDESIAILAHENDESHGDAAEREFNNGILCGTQQSTLAMMVDDILKQEIEEREELEAVLQRTSSKIATNSRFTEKLVIADSNKKLNESQYKELVEQLIDLSYKALTDHVAAKHVQELVASNFANAEEIANTAKAYKKIHGRQIALPTYKLIQDGIKQNQIKKIKAEIHPEVTKIILKLNTCDKKNDLVRLVGNLSKEQVVSVYEAAVTYWKTTPALCMNADVAREVKARYVQIKGVKVASAKSRNSRVRNVFVA